MINEIRVALLTGSAFAVVAEDKASGGRIIIADESQKLVASQSGPAVPVAKDCKVLVRAGPGIDPLLEHWGLPKEDVAIPICGISVDVTAAFQMHRQEAQRFGCFDRDINTCAKIRVSKRQSRDIRMTYKVDPFENGKANVLLAYLGSGSASAISFASRIGPARHDYRPAIARKYPLCCSRVLHLLEGNDISPKTFGMTAQGCVISVSPRLAPLAVFSSKMLDVPSGNR